MQSEANGTTEQWWAEGDAPVRTQSRVTPLIDGRTTLLTMCRHFVKARRYIYLANWGMTPTMELVRGIDHFGQPGAQNALIEALRAEGLTEVDIAFWLAGPPLSLENVLRYAVEKGVEVKALLWKSAPLLSPCDAIEAHQQLTQRGITCLLDDSAVGILHHPVESLHQKITIVDGVYAFVGGIDPLIETSGDFDRWDTPEHLYVQPLRVNAQGVTPHPWHDVHTLIEGPAVADVETNFRQRWNDVVHHHGMHHALLVPEHPLPPEVASTSMVQIVRTIPKHTYHFPSSVIRGIAQVYQQATRNVRRFIYLENQYFWLHAFYGIDLPFAGTDSPEMEENVRNLGVALRKGAAAALILPDHPNAGRAFTDAGLARLREEAPEAVDEGRLEPFCLATSTRQEGREHYRPIYVHAKVAVVDDLWCTVGSANLNNRGMADDTELNVAVLDAELAQALRIALQAEHLGLVQGHDLLVLSRLVGRRYQSPDERRYAERLYYSLQEALGDPLKAMHLMHERAWDNLRRFQANQPLIGHLLPYLTQEEAQYQGLPFQEEHGWIEEPMSTEQSQI
jgi:phosphatidylserine/phosphatidylglycerophosphate/cardiolipin synthase-like enzyme